MFTFLPPMRVRESPSYFTSLLCFLNALHGSYRTKYNQMSTMFGRMTARLDEKVPVGPRLAAVGSLKFGFGALLPFGLLFDTLMTTFGDLRVATAVC